MPQRKQSHYITWNLNIVIVIIQKGKFGLCSSLSLWFFLPWIIYHFRAKTECWIKVQRTHSTSSTKFKWIPLSLSIILFSLSLADLMKHFFRKASEVLSFRFYSEISDWDLSIRPAVHALLPPTLSLCLSHPVAIKGKMNWVNVKWKDNNDGESHWTCLFAFTNECFPWSSFASLLCHENTAVKSKAQSR